jgi:uncharacterized repeat protein (TIGR01451 family)
MFTRVIQRKRPRLSALLFMGGAIVAAGLFAAIVLAVVPIFDTGTVGPDFDTPCDVTVADNTTSEDCQLGPAGAFVSYIGSSDTLRQSSGTGLFDPFLRLQADPNEQGFNTDAKATLDAKPGPWTKAILVSAIPVVACNRFTGDTARCWELFVDINENNTAKRVSLNKVEIYFTDAQKLTGYPGFATPTGNTHALQYAFSGNILINDVNEGSGRGDLRYLVPLADIPTPAAGTWFVLYSQWGTTSGTAGEEGTGAYTSDGGFEEWKVKKAPNVSIVKTADAESVNAGSNIGFTITVTNTGAADATGVTVDDPLPSGTDVDWSIASQSPAGSCSISGSPPSETLSCGPLTLASGGGQLTVHVTSTTTGDSCGLYDNTATFTSTNAGTGSDDASVIVNCGAIQIRKETTKTAGQLVANAGAVFSITGPGSYSQSVEDNGTGSLDEDPAVGVVCISGLAPGDYTVNETSPPDGYGGASETDVTATAVNGTDCDSSRPVTDDLAVFTNAPLSDIQVNFRDGGSGETSATISCDNPDGTQDLTKATGWDTSDTETDVSAPVIVTCTITIDP